LMMTHHVVVAILLTGSWFLGVLRVGVLVLYIHEVCDIIISSMKIAQYLKSDMESFGIPILDAIFVLNLFSWSYYRLYLLPFNIIYACLFIMPRHFPAVSTLHQHGLTLMIAFLCLWNLMHVYWLFLTIASGVQLARVNRTDETKRKN